MTSQPQIIIIQDDKPNHLLHLILSLLTMGLWIPVWFLVAMKYRLKKQNRAARSVGNSFMTGFRAGRG